MLALCTVVMNKLETVARCLGLKDSRLYSDVYLYRVHHNCSSSSGLFAYLCSDVYLTSIYCAGLNLNNVTISRVIL